MTLNEITDEVLAKLKDIFPELECDHFPGNPEEYNFVHPVGAVQVLYRDRRFNTPQATDGTVQTNNPEIAISYYTRNLRSTGKDTAMYDLLDRGRNGIASNNDIGQGFMWIKRERLLSRKNGVWIFVQTWELEDIFIPNDE